MNWNIESTSIIGFSVKHLMFTNVKGRFHKLNGKIDWDQENITNSVIEASVEANSIETGDKNRDKHLRSPEFFDVKHFSTLSFKSKRIKKVGTGKYQLTGDLTIKNICREVTFLVEYAGRASDPFAGSSANFRASATINRKAFGLGWSPAVETGGMLVGDTVTIALQIKVAKESGIETEEAA